MTLFGIDISDFQGGMSVARAKNEGFSWVEAKVSEGNYFAAADWEGFLLEAQACGMPIIGYHYANASCSPASQAALYKSNGGLSNVMIDFENSGGNIADYWNLVTAFNNAGVNVALSYMPRWYWSNIGSPDLTGVPGLVSSAYPTSGHDFASNIYARSGGDTGAGWNGYGNNTPVIWQFTDAANVAGYSVDANAFRGTIEELKQLLGGVTDMQLSDTFTDAYGNQVSAADALKWISYHADLTVDQLGGTGTRNGIPGQFTGWSQLGGNTVVDALAVIGEKLGIPGFGLPTPPTPPANS